MKHLVLILLLSGCVAGGSLTAAPDTDYMPDAAPEPSVGVSEPTTGEVGPKPDSERDFDGNQRWR